MFHFLYRFTRRKSFVSLKTWIPADVFASVIFTTVLVKMYSGRYFRSHLERDETALSLLPNGSYGKLQVWRKRVAPKRYVPLNATQNGHSNKRFIHAAVNNKFLNVARSMNRSGDFLSPSSVSRYVIYIRIESPVSCFGKNGQTRTILAYRQNCAIRLRKRPSIRIDSLFRSPNFSRSYFASKYPTRFYVFSSSVRYRQALSLLAGGVFAQRLVHVPAIDNERYNLLCVRDIITSDKNHKFTRVNAREGRKSGRKNLIILSRSAWLWRILLIKQTVIPPRDKHQRYIHEC